MDSISNTISQVLFLITVVIIGVEGVMSLLDRLGFLPKILEKFYVAREKRTIKLTLGELGIADSKRFIKQAMDYWHSEALTTNIDEKSTLFSFIKSATRELKADVGLYKKVRLSYYIDLAEHTTNWESLQTLAQIVCLSIRKSLASLEETIQIDKIAAPPGNPALGVIIAAKLDRPFVSVTPISPLASDPISGRIDQNDHILLVHDVVLTGEKIADVAKALRNAGAIVEHAFVLVERTDARKNREETPTETLKRNGVSLHPVISIDDDGLKSLLSKREKRL